MTPAFRCAAASLDRDEPLSATASTVRAFVLVEFAGAWGQDALRDARLPAEVREHLLQLSRLGVKTLLIRRHGRRAATAGTTVFVAWCGRSSQWMETATLASLDDLVSLDLAPVARGERVGLAPHAQPIVCVCTHGRHDTCCAERGRPLAAALSASYPGLGWEISHIGGDRFAANMLILPDGLYYGRVPPEHGSRLVAEHLDGRLDLEHLRGRSSLPLGAQAAELFLRRRLDEPRIGAVRVTRVRREGDAWTVDLEVGRQRWQATVVTSRAARAQLTCAVHKLASPPVFREVQTIRIE